MELLDRETGEDISNLSILLVYECCFSSQFQGCILLGLSSWRFDSDFTLDILLVFTAWTRAWVVPIGFILVVVCVSVLMYTYQDIF